MVQVQVDPMFLFCRAAIRTVMFVLVRSVSRSPEYRLVRTMHLQNSSSRSIGSPLIPKITIINFEHLFNPVCNLVIMRRRRYKWDLLCDKALLASTFLRHGGRRAAANTAYEGIHRQDKAYTSSDSARKGKRIEVVLLFTDYRKS